MEVTIREAKTRLSRLLRRVEAGEEIVIRRGRQPVAMLVRAPAPAGRRQIWGDFDGAMGQDFDDVPEGFAPHGKSPSSADSRLAAYGAGVVW